MSYGRRSVHLNHGFRFPFFRFFSKKKFFGRVEKFEKVFIFFSFFSTFFCSKKFLLFFFDFFPSILMLFFRSFFDFLLEKKVENFFSSFFFSSKLDLNMLFSANKGQLYVEKG